MTHWTIGCCLLGLGVFGNLSGPVLGNDQSIDTFEYADADAAQQVWHGVAERGEGLALQVVTDQGRSVLEMPTPFASQTRYCPRLYGS